MTRRKQNFSRFNQPVACRMCGKSTTWSDANGHAGLALCKDCFEEASLENEHNDGYHVTHKHPACPQCAAKTFTLGDEQYRVLMSALQHAIDVYQDTRQPRTEAEATAVQTELRRQANAQYEARRASENQ